DVAVRAVADGDVAVVDAGGHRKAEGLQRHFYAHGEAMGGRPLAVEVLQSDVFEYGHLRGSPYDRLAFIPGGESEDHRHAVLFRAQRAVLGQRHRHFFAIGVDDGDDVALHAPRTALFHKAAHAHLGGAVLVEGHGDLHAE